MKSGFFIFIFFISGALAYAEGRSSAPPSVSAIANPFARTSSSSAGFSFGLGVSPDLTSSQLSSVFLETQVLFSVPYSRDTNDNRNDLVLSFALFFPVSEGNLLGARGGVTNNLSDSLFPVLFLAGAYRYVFFPRLFSELDLGYSATGFHYLTVGFGWVLF